MTCPFCSAETEASADTCFSCGRSLFHLIRGTTLSNRYEIQATLGRGGMGMVYKAHDRELDEIVAIKLLHGDMARSADAAKRFRNEIRLARRVRHRNVCAIHEYGQHEHVRYIVMEYLEGTDYKKIIQTNGPLDAIDACSVACQVADALQAIHEAGVVHRDLKTANIMRDVRGVVRLMDFGIAKQLTGDTFGATATGLIVGTPEYMSPEQARAEKVDARSDVYALGVVLHELLTGDVPLRGDTPLATLMKHLSERPRLDSGRLAAEIVPILRKALAKDREERYGSAEEMGAALRAAVPGIPATPRGETPRPYRPTLPAVDLDQGLDGGGETTPMPTPVPTRMGTATRAGAAPAAVTAAGTLDLPAAAPPPADAPPTRDGGVSTAVRGRRGAALVGLGAVLVATAYGAWFAGRSLRDTPEPAPALTTIVASEPSLPPPLPPPQDSLPAPAVRPSEPPSRVTGRQPPAVPSARAGAPIASEFPPTASPVAGSPARVAVAVPTATPAPAVLEPPVASAPATAAPAVGLLQIGARPYAEVLVDGKSVGLTPMRPLSLPAGVHTVRLLHPDYRPFTRRVTVKPGETAKLVIDWSFDGARKEP